MNRRHSILIAAVVVALGSFLGAILSRKGTSSPESVRSSKSSAGTQSLPAASELLPVSAPLTEPARSGDDPIAQAPVPDPEVGQAPPPDPGPTEVDFESKYAGMALQELRGARAGLAAMVNGRIRDLMEEKLRDGDYTETLPSFGPDGRPYIPPPQDAQVYGASGTAGSEVARVMTFDDDPEIAAMRKEHSWLGQRIRTLEKR